MPRGDKCDKKKSCRVRREKDKVRSYFRWRGIKEATFEQRPGLVREGARQVSGERPFQAKGMASAKALRQARADVFEGQQEGQGGGAR